MNRRSFLSLISGAAAASTVSYFLPPIGGWHSDIIAHADEWWQPHKLQRVSESQANESLWRQHHLHARRVLGELCGHVPADSHVYGGRCAGRPVFRASRSEETMSPLERLLKPASISEPTLLTVEDWERSIFGPAKDSGHQAAIIAFVARKVAEGYRDLFLFKNRAGQFVYAVYDPESGNPCARDAVYLVYGNPAPGGEPAVMPAVGTVSRLWGMAITGILIDFRMPIGELEGELTKAFEALVSADSGGTATREQ